MVQIPALMLDKLDSPYLVRSYSPEDRPALEAMYTSFEPKRVAQGLPPGNEEGRRRWLDRVLARGTHLIVEVEKVLLGHVMLIPIGGGRAELANFLHQAIRNRGIGTELNRIIVDLAGEQGFSSVWLSVEPANRAAMRSYEKVGFRKLPGSLWAPEIEMEVGSGAAPRG